MEWLCESRDINGNLQNCIIILLLLSFFLGSGLFQLQRYVSTGLCSWAGISECFVLFSCDNMFLWYFVSFWQDTRFDFGIFSMSINDEWIIREFLHFLIMEVFVHSCLWFYFLTCLFHFGLYLHSHMCILDFSCVPLQIGIS